MDGNAPVKTLVIYRPKAGAEKALGALVQKHLPTLRSLGLMSPEAGQVWRAQDKRSGAVSFVEIFEWRDGKASEIAHQTPEVMAVWETMGPLLEGLELRRLDPL